MLSQSAVATAEGQNCGNSGGYHYAGQLTAKDNTFTHCGVTTEYQGWNGVQGQFQTPATMLTLGNYQEDHTLGLFSAQLAYDAYWLQTGWFTGTITDLPVPITPAQCLSFDCVQRSGTYGRYMESLGPAGYVVIDYGQAPLNSVVTSRIAYDASNGCWDAWVTYPGTVSFQDCTETAIIGAMWSTSEMLSNSGITAPLPVAYFGVLASTTSQALRLHYGSKGWELWDGTLTAQYTERFDERLTTPKYTISGISSCCWYFKTYL